MTACLPYSSAQIVNLDRNLGNRLWRAHSLLDEMRRGLNLSRMEMHWLFVVDRLGGNIAGLSGGFRMSPFSRLSTGRRHLKMAGSTHKSAMAVVRKNAFRSSVFQVCRILIQLGIGCNIDVYLKIRFISLKNLFTFFVQ